ncbi:hypothetical protein MXB_4830 [Myxobolus squamalis]|nr:hypothetical protein MXB_4830 [Myxobolus squamalis]
MINYYNEHPVKLREPGITVHTIKQYLTIKPRAIVVVGLVNRHGPFLLLILRLSLQTESCTYELNIGCVVREGSTIYTDELSSYKCLSDLSYDHRKIIHKYNFVCPESSVNT